MFVQKTMKRCIAIHVGVITVHCIKSYTDFRSHGAKKSAFVIAPVVLLYKNAHKVNGTQGDYKKSK